MHSLAVGGSELNPPALIRKLAAHTPLSVAELAPLERFLGELRTVVRRRDIITEGHKYSALFTLVDGIAIRYGALHSGRRHIINVVLPGDLIGFPASFFASALYSVTAVTDVAVAEISFERLYEFFGKYPRIGAAIFWLFSCEAAMYAERLIGTGQRSAPERVAHFLLELLMRLRVIGLGDERGFRMPLTQERRFGFSEPRQPPGGKMRLPSHETAFDLTNFLDPVRYRDNAEPLHNATPGSPGLCRSLDFIRRTEFS